MRKMLEIMMLAGLMAAPMGVGAQCIFDFSLREAYAEGARQNDERNYLEAYRLLASVSDSLDAAMQAAGKTAATLNETEFNVFYWPIKRSLAEVAYMIGQHFTMLRISTELKAAIGEDNDNPAIRQRRAEVAKIDAGIHYITEDFDKAEQELLEAQALSSPYEYLFRNVLHEELAQLYYRQGRYAEALAELDSLGTYATRLIVDEAAKRKDDLATQRAICLARLGNFSDALKTLNPIVTRYSKGTDRRAYAEALRKQGKILMLQQEATGKYTSEAKHCYETYLKTARIFLNNNFIDMSESEREQFWMAEHPFVTDCFRLEEHAPELLYDVALFGKALLLQLGRRLQPDMTAAERRVALSSMQVSWKDVQRQLPDTAVAVEFIVYEKMDRKHIGALVLGKNYKLPEFVYIAPVDSIAQRVIHRGKTVEDIIQSLHDSYMIDTLYNDRELHSLIWNQRLVELIGNSKAVFFAPDGIFHQLGVEYLLPETLRGRRFYRLTSTRLLTEPQHKLRHDNMLLMGGVNYRTEQSSVLPESNDALAYSIMSATGMHLSSLPGSAAEIDSVAAVRANPADRIFHADSATEAVLKSLANKYHLVLISTHGYFDEATTLGTELRPASTDAQLSHSCLFMAGAERNMNDASFDASKQDGILSARELAGLDLSNVDLAVLSACMSGLGFVTPDGVFGLQRGLKTAGVRAVVASMWEVDDAATSLLMRYLYTNLEKGMSLYDAFASARLILKETEYEMRYPGGFVRTVSFDSPYLYNAFILIDGLE